MGPAITRAPNLSLIRARELPAEIPPPDYNGAEAVIRKTLASFGPRQTEKGRRNCSWPRTW